MSTRPAAPPPRRLGLTPAEYALVRRDARGLLLPPPFDRVPPADAITEADRAAAVARLRAAGVLDGSHHCHPALAAGLLCHETAEVRVRADVSDGDEVLAVRAAASALLASVLTVRVVSQDGQPRWVSPVTVTTCAIDDLVPEVVSPLSTAGLEPADGRSPTTVGGQTTDRPPTALRPVDADRLEATLDLRVTSGGDVAALAWVRVDGRWWEPIARPEADGVHLDLATADGGLLARRLTTALTRRLAQGAVRG